MWQYTLNPELHLSEDLFRRYSEVFSHPPWIGTAFKGATSSCAQVPNIRHYVGNHLAWIAMINRLGITDLSGIVFTGWQRFDHFASLCELLPVSVPSLRCCLRALERKKFDEADANETFRELGLTTDDGLAEFTNKFPGYDLYKVVVERFGTVEKWHHIEN